MLPADYLNYSVTDLLSEIKSVDIKSVIASGLNNDIQDAEYIRYPDGTEIRNLCCIFPNGTVYMSPLFRQGIWCMCYSTILLTDILRIKENIKPFGIEFELFKQMVQDLNNSESLVESIQSQFPGISNEIIAEFRYMIEFLNSEMQSQSWKDILILSLKCFKKDLSQEDERFLNSIDISGTYAQKINGLYRSAVAFSLLHELFHFEKGHFGQRKDLPRIDKEIEADNYAFDCMINDFEGAQRNSNIIAMLCTLCSFFFINPTFNNNGDYPYEDERLFSQYDKVSNFDNKEEVILNILRVWAIGYCIPDYMKTTDNGTNISKVRSYLSTYGRS